MLRNKRDNIDNTAIKLLEEEGLKVIRPIEEGKDVTVYLCRRKDRTKIEAAIIDGTVVIAPEK